MSSVVQVSKRGTVTIPPEFRRSLGLDKVSNPLVILEESEGKLILVPATAVPVRDLSKDEIESWIAEDEAGMDRYRKER